jgi:peptide/nickel transport system ATP-binding protein
MRCFPHEFSGGLRQRIGIARALILRPKIIICDEPVSALDVSIQAQVINLLSDLKAEFNLSYILIAHDLSVVNHVSDRIAVMYLGKVIELASNKKLLAKPLHPYTQALLSAVPILDPDQKKKRIVLKGDVPSPVNPPAGCRFHPRCFKAMEICSRREPLWAEVEPNHFAMCHLFEACRGES